MVKCDYIWAIFAITIIHKMYVHQFDICIAFFNGNLVEEIYMI
jgi:hypothetical protein